MLESLFPDPPVVLNRHTSPVQELLEEFSSGIFLTSGQEPGIPGIFRMLNLGQGCGDRSQEFSANRFLRPASMPSQEKRTFASGKFP
jgi:hypothetical protein